MLQFAPRNWALLIIQQSPIVYGSGPLYCDYVVRWAVFRHNFCSSKAFVPGPLLFMTLKMGFFIPILCFIPLYI